MSAARDRLMPYPRCVPHPRRHTTAFVREAFAKRGFTIPANYCYVSTHTRIPYTHTCGFRGSISYANFQSGYGCPRCSNTEIPSSDYVRKAFATAGYDVGEDFLYQGAHEKIPYYCRRCRRSWAIKWNDFQQGHGCPGCAGNAKPILPFLRMVFGVRGYILLSEEYVNCNTKLAYWCCECMEERRRSWNHFKRGVGCRIRGYARLTKRAQERRSRRDLRLVQMALEHVRRD
jgi:hypothetical protein